MKLISDKLDALLTTQALETYPSTTPRHEIKLQLSELTPRELRALSMGDAELSECALSGLWLLHGFLDQSHSISQSIATPEGCFWHAIMHRLERDFWNSKYWYRQVGQHDVLKLMGARIGRQHHGTSMEHWDPAEFVDRCQVASTSDLDSTRYELRYCLQNVARIEWVTLFQYCLPGYADRIAQSPLLTNL
jgi:hypothetical protein